MSPRADALYGPSPKVDGASPGAYAVVPTGRQILLVAIHQPHYLPWLGYLHRMARADLFVLLDHVQFERRNYQNRAGIRIGGESRWLTVPVEQHSRDESLVEKRVDNRLEGQRAWQRIHSLTLHHAYREARYRDAFDLGGLYATRFEKLVDLDIASTEFLREAFAIRTPLVRSSQLAPEGTKSEMVLDICRRVGASALLVGLGASRRYLERAAFARAGIKMVFQDFVHPVYRQCGTAPFVPGLSAIDALLNCGAQHARRMLAAGPREQTGEMRLAA